MEAEPQLKQTGELNGEGMLFCLSGKAGLLEGKASSTPCAWPVFVKENLTWGSEAEKTHCPLG